MNLFRQLFGLSPRRNHQDTPFLGRWHSKSLTKSQ
jgi:hypothetical protein